ncbi:MAG: DNA polymerase III subunit alpha [Planctomycetes bacterium]|nr:DNA polymerase III subunit alpha [Planctomycetota bacterium]
MSTRPFVHLHCHTHYSLLDGASRIPELVQRVKACGMSAVAMTDHGNLYGAIEFYKECRGAGINPILGYEAYVAPGKRSDRESRRSSDEADDATYHHLTLLAKNVTGFKNLIKMSSLAFLEGYHRKPRIDKELLEAHGEGIICLSGCAAAEFSDYILRDRLEEAERLAVWFKKLFKDDFYIEIQNNGLEIQRLCAAGAIDIANRLGLPLVATSDAHYLRKEDSLAHDVLLCINTGKTRSNPKRFRFEGNEFFVRSPEEMYALFPGHEEAVKRSQEIANSVDIQLDFRKRHFPVFAPPEGKTAEDYLRELCAKGVRERYGDSPSQTVLERLDHELGIICRMGFASYFLIVWDFVRFALENDIPASARGSACGALVSYVLKLSHVDPLEYDLLFERFLDPNRAEAPDIDIDFCQDRREQVINYVRQKYGEMSVAQIATFGTLAARIAIKDVGRVLDVPPERFNQLAKMVPTTLHITLEEALAQSPDLRQAYNSDPVVREVIDIARTLEGTNRNSGTHAAGVVIANGSLMDYVPLQRMVRKGEDGTRKGEAVITTQWVMGDLEKVGLLKMDFLGLRTLTLIDNCLRLIRKTRPKEQWIDDVYKLPMDDRKTYELLQRGDAKGVFQLESDGIRELLKRLKPDNIRDIIALNALYRPGPLGGGMVDSYVNCKHGREKPVYVHPVMEEVLGETYGVMVFQEQVMRILNRLGGIELSSAYACIKAISKKKQEIIDQRQADFLKGASERGADERLARDIFDKIVYFAGYGFNRSHSAAYAHIGYYTAYLKAHYTPEFFAALLSSEIEDGNKRDIMVQHIDDARKFGVEVLPPCVNASEPAFSVAGKKVVFGLMAIKGLGRAASEEVLRARSEGGPFRDLFDFCERIDAKVVSRKAMETLIKAGALDRLGGHRAQLLHALPRAWQAAQERQRDRKVGQASLFEDIEEENAVASAVDAGLPDVPPWSEKDKLTYEKEVLDFYLTSHPLAQSEKEIQRYTSHTTDQVATLQPGQEVTLGGMLTQIRIKVAKNSRSSNATFLRCKVEDFTGTVECVMWGDEFARCKELAQEDRVCFVKGSIDERSTREQPVLVLTRILSVEQMQREGCSEVWLRLKLGEHLPHLVDRIAEVLKRYPGNCPVRLCVFDTAGRQSVLKLGRQFGVNPRAFLPSEIEDFLGAGSVRLLGSGNGNGR